MNYRMFTTIAILLLGTVVNLSACTRTTKEPTPDLAMIVARTQTAISLNQLLTATGAVSPTPAIKEETPIATPEITPGQVTPECTDQAEYAGETVPDGTIFSPGESFEKTWLMRNAGTCTWTDEYAVVFDRGDQLGGVSSIWLTGVIPPGEQTEIMVPLTAPQEEGEFQGFWKLQNQNGLRFGLGENAEVAFWVKINVSKNDHPLNLGSPSWEESFEGNNPPFYLGEDENISFEVKDGQLEMTAIKSAGDQWRIAQVGYLEDFYLEADFITGDTCIGKDSYGLLIRAPDQPDNIIDSGYVFIASCDGNIRAYLMKNGQFFNLVNWTPNASVIADPNKINRLGIKAQGSNFQMYVNDILVTEFEDTTYTTGYFGLSIRSDSTPNFQVFVQQIAYWLADF